MFEGYDGTNDEMKESEQYMHPVEARVLLKRKMHAFAAVSSMICIALEEAKHGNMEEK